MNNIVVRLAKNTDDLLKIASCIYLTDSFIYPAAFGVNIEQAANAISKLMNIKDGLFSLDNIVLAICEEEICGIVLYNKKGVVWNKDICTELIKEIVPSIEQFNRVADEYFSVEAVRPIENHIEVIACCVLPNFRNRGIARCMLEWLIKEYPEDTLQLDVLADNSAAIRLYKTCGFQIVEKFRGFSVDELTRPDCFRMTFEPGRDGGKVNEKN